MNFVHFKIYYKTIRIIEQNSVQHEFLFSIHLKSILEPMRIESNRRG